MSKFIHMMSLKPMNPSCTVRNMQGAIKTVTVNGSTRLNISTQSLKRVLRTNLFEDPVVFKDCSIVHKFLAKMQNEGRMQITKYDEVGKAFCKVLNDIPYCAPDKPKSEDNGPSVYFDRKVLEAVLNDAVAFFNDVGEKEFVKKGGEAAAERAKAIYEAANVLPDRAMFGNMSTGSVVDGIYGAFRAAMVYSIDPLAGDIDDFVTTFRGTAGSNADDFFADVLNPYIAEQQAKPNADNLGSRELASNTVFASAAVMTDELLNNLMKHNSKSATPYTDEEAMKIARETTAQALIGYAKVNAGGHQRDMASETLPGIILITAGQYEQPYAACFDKPYTYDAYNNKSVMEQGIEHLAQFVADDAFYEHEVRRYVVLASQYAHLAPLFTEAGVTVLKNVRELSAAIQECYDWTLE